MLWPQEKPGRVAPARIVVIVTRLTFGSEQHRGASSGCKPNMSAAPQQQQQQQQRMLTTVQIQQVCVMLRYCSHRRCAQHHGGGAAAAAAHHRLLSDSALPCSSCLQMLDENAKLIAAIVENQNLGKLNECIE